MIQPIESSPQPEQISGGRVAAEIIGGLAVFSVGEAIPNPVISCALVVAGGVVAAKGLIESLDLIPHR